jgi:SAM-dependent methyltransferase
MEFSDLVTISQGTLEIMNPVSPEKIVTIGSKASIGKSSSVIEFGCGNGTILALWAEHFDISGTGIDIRCQACDKAREKLKAVGKWENFRVFCIDGAIYDSGGERYDLAVCLGASDIWGGFEDALYAMKEVLGPDGKIIIGERYWKNERVAPEFAREWPEIQTEYEILRIIRTAGFELSYVVRATEDDWDAYEAGIWQSCIAWIEDHPNHPDNMEVANYMHNIQDEYLAFGREYVGWAMYLLTPALQEIDRI